MAEPFVAEIRMIGCNFAPRGWAFCEGQLLPISQNTALFSLLGTTYGGDGRTTFALPDLRGRAPMHSGAGPGLTVRSLGEQEGTAAVTLIESEIPAHRHAVQGSSSPASQNGPTTDSALARSAGGAAYHDGVADQPLAAPTVGLAGGSLPHNNLQPYLVVNFIIALQGVFPPRS